MKTSRFSLRTVAMVAVLVWPMQGAHAVDSVVPPGDEVAGYSQRQLAERWWQWVLHIPAATSPLTDTTGEFAGTDNTGPVFFVAGNTGGSSTRSFEVPAGKPIFFPVVNGVDVEVPGSTSVADAFACCLGFVDTAANLHATLDGNNLLVRPNDQTNPSRQTSTEFFTVDVPVDNPFGWTAPYVGMLDTVSDGFWVALDGLSPGKHTLKFGGKFAAKGQRPGIIGPITVHITAAAPAISQAQCSKDGWKALGFKNQGQCVQFANTGQ